jgi:thiamine-monophosphate kinase
MAKKGEFALIDWIRRRSRFGKDVVIGVGDDTAAVRPAKGTLTLLTTDAVIEGTHFKRPAASAYRIGWKAMAASISDIAAMAGVPRYALVAVTLPDGLPMKWPRDFYKGLRAVADRFRVGIIGGNVASWKGGVAVTVSIIGECKGAPIPRGGAKAGDVIFVTGAVGGSLMGRHLRFLPRIKEALALRKTVRVHSMIDISDGLSRDLGHICEESGVGAVLYESEIPVSPDARRAARKSGRPALQHALSDGEDYELLFTVSEKDAKRLVERPPFRSTRLTPIGVIVQRGMYLQHPDGGKSTLKPKGYEHFT